MSSRVIKIDRPIRHIAIPVPTLRIGQIRNDCVRLHKAVNIRRIRDFPVARRKARY
jgi:hypothetical protein